MAPKKNDENTAKKTPKKRAVKPKVEKPKLKTPSILKLRVSAVPRDLNGVSLKFNKKQLTEEKKLELANEVAFKQLFKTPEVMQDVPPAPPPVVAETKSLSKTRGRNNSSTAGPEKVAPLKRKKRSSNEVIPDDNSDNVLKIENPPKKTTKKPAIKRTAAQRIEAALLCKDENNGSTEPTAKKTRGRNLTRLKPNHTLVNKVDEEKIEEPQLKEEVLELPSESNVQLPKPVNKTPSIVAKRSTRKKCSPKRYQANGGKHVSVKADTKSAEVSQAGAVVSRKTSCNSTGSADRHSWTQDISSSSTTTCVSVTSNDFVRIDKKLPLLQMVPLSKHRVFVEQNSKLVSQNNELVQNSDAVVSKESESSSSSSSSSSSDSEDEVDGERLNLSASTSLASDTNATKSKANPSQDNSRVLDELLALVERELSLLETKDLDSRLGLHDLVPPTSEPIHEALKPEMEVLVLARLMNKCLSEMTDEFARPAPPRPRLPPAPERRLEEYATQRSRLASVDNDNDDAISLFAESITGFESSRVSVVPDEYIPAPVVPPPVSRRYRPTRIETTRRLTVCEVHTADSTSIRDAGARNASQQFQREQQSEFQTEFQHEPQQFLQNQQRRDPTFESLQLDSEFTKFNSLSDIGLPKRQFSEAKSVLTSSMVLPPVTSTRRPVLHAQSVQQVLPHTPSGSALFRGVCFYNVTKNNCRFHPCRFKHDTLENFMEEFRRRLNSLDDPQLLREMRLVWGFPGVRKRLAALFSSILAKRGLTRTMMEALEEVEFIPETNLAFEEALLHLNNIDLNEVQDMLKSPLCDAFLSTLANTQNFSRFRAVFTKLAAHMADCGLPVSLDVAMKILERVCILPGEETLSRAMLQLIKRTDRKIYDSHVMDSFETQLDGIDAGLHEEFLLEREKRRGSRSSPALVPKPCEPRERYTSPDTTHFDTKFNVPPPTLSSTITRTIDLKKSQTNTKLVSLGATTPSPNVKQIHSFPWRKPYPKQQRPNSPRTPGRPHVLRAPMLRPNMPNMGNRTVRWRPTAVPYGASINYQRSF